MAIAFTPRVLGSLTFGAIIVSALIVGGERAAAASAEATDDRVLPYLLRYAEVGGDGESPVVVGAIYTPFLRIATIAQCGGATGSSLVDADQILVALRWYNEQPGFENVELRALAIPRGRLTLAQSVEPLWTRPGSDFETIVGCPAPWPDVALIAAFSGELFTPEVDFVIFKELQDGSLLRRQFKHARIPRAAFPTWR